MTKKTQRRPVTYPRSHRLGLAEPREPSAARVQSPRLSPAETETSLCLRSAALSGTLNGNPGEGCAPSPGGALTASWRGSLGVGASLAHLDREAHPPPAPDFQTGCQGRPDSGVSVALTSLGVVGSRPPELVPPGWACARPAAEVTAARKNHGRAQCTLPPPALCLRLPQSRPGPLEEQEGGAGPVEGPGWPRLRPPGRPKALLPGGSAGGPGETGPASSLLVDSWLFRCPPAVTRFRGPHVDGHAHVCKADVQTGQVNSLLRQVSSQAPLLAQVPLTSFSQVFKK